MLRTPYPEARLPIQARLSKLVAIRHPVFIIIFSQLFGTSLWFSANSATEVVKHLVSATEILVAGPGSANLELIKHIHKHDTALTEKIVV